MMFGHPPPAPGSLRTRLIQRLAYLDRLLEVGLDEFLSKKDPAAWLAARARIQEYIAFVEGLVRGTPSGTPTYTDQVLMDVPVCVIEQETGTSEWFVVVGPDQVNPGEGLISLLSPLGSALLLRRVGDTFELNAPGGCYHYRVGTIGSEPPKAS